MKRLLIVSGDRAFTRSAAETLVDRDLNLYDEPASVDWEVARAHSALEAFVLLNRGGRPFDALLVDTPLPDQHALALLQRVRRSEAGRMLPVFLLTERGQDPHVRRAAADSLGTTRFLDKPSSPDVLRAHLDGLSEQLRVVLAEGNVERRGRYADALTDGGYAVEAMATGREAIERQPRLRPSAVVSNLQLPDVTGLTVCAHVRRAAVVPAPRVVLYGQLSALTAQRHEQNVDRADDFVQAPFDDELLVERVAELIGRTDSSRRWRRTSALTAITEDLPTGPVPNPSRRKARRIPGRVRVEIRYDAERLQTETLDLSPGGVFLRTPDPIPIGTKLDLHIDLGDGGAVIRSVGRVAWNCYSGPKKGVGAELTSLDDEAQARLEAYVARVGRVVYEP